MKVGKKQSSLLGAIAFGTVIALTPTSGSAIYFSGKKIEITIPTKEGGGSDRFGRIFQPFLEKHLPGHPTVLVINRPGGSGIKGGNWFQHKAPRDGTALFVTGSSPLNSFLFAGKKVQYQLRTWKPIILSSFGTCFYAHKRLGLSGKPEDVVADIKKLRAADRLLMGAKNSTSSEIRSFLLYDIMGMDQARPVFGLSSGNRRKATLRGELELGMDSTLSCQTKIKKYVDKGTIQIYMTMGLIDDNGKIVRDPAMPDVPHAKEVYEKVYGKEPSGQAWKAYMHFLNLNVMAQKGLWLPDGTPDDVYEFYVSTFKKIFADKEFQKITKKSFGKYPHAFGEKAKKIAIDALDFAPETKEWMKNWIKKKMVSSS
ncbi:MAG: hypothetical protein WD407_10690 [Rhodospirillales bacterium]